MEESQSGSCWSGIGSSTSAVMRRLEVALMNPSVGPVFDALFNGQRRMVGAQILLVGVAIKGAGPNHNSTPHRLDRNV